MPGSDSVVSRSQLTPDASRIEWRSAGALDGRRRGHRPVRGGHRGGRRRRGFGRPAVVEQQLVERHVELGGDGVQRADRRVGAPGLDLRDEARRDAEPLGQRPQAQAPGPARLAQALAHLRVVRTAGAWLRWDWSSSVSSCGHAQNIIRPLSTTRSIPSTDGFSSRNRVPSTISSIVASFLVMVFDSVALEDRRRLAVPVRAVAGDARVDGVDPDRRQLPGERPGEAGDPAVDRRDGRRAGVRPVLGLAAEQHDRAVRRQAGRAGRGPPRRTRRA